MTDLKAFRRVCYEAARRIGGELTELRISVEPTPNFYQAIIAYSNRSVAVVCARDAPLLALAVPRVIEFTLAREAGPLTFVDFPDLAATLGVAPGFRLLTAAELEGPIDAAKWLTPRTAAALWAVAQVHADFAYDDVQHHGDDPVTDDGSWAAFNEYPRITWTQDAVWRRQAARAFDDLTDDLAAGRLPSPTCPGEEMALHVMLRSAQAAIADGWGPTPDLLASLPEDDGDYDWDLAEEVLLQDDDILNLFDQQMDGIEDPDSEANQYAGMGDYRPAAWFRPFSNMTPRDGRRRFRR